MVYTSFGRVIFASILCIYNIFFAMEQADQSKEMYTLFYFKSGQYKLRYENDLFCKELIINSRNINCAPCMQSVDQQFSISLSFLQGCDFDLYRPLSLDNTDLIRQSFIKMTFEQLQSCYNGYNSLGCAADFIDTFHSCLLLKACQKYTKLGACIKKYFLIWNESTYPQELEALGFCKNEREQFDKISNTILQHVMPSFLNILSQKINKNIVKIIKEDKNIKKAINFFINQFIVYFSQSQVDLQVLLNSTEFRRILKEDFLKEDFDKETNLSVFFTIVNLFFKLFDGTKYVSKNKNSIEQIWLEVKEKLNCSENVPSQADQLPISMAEDKLDNNSTCVFVLRKILYNDDCLDTSMLPLNEYICFMNNVLCPLGLIKNKKIKGIKVLGGPSLDKTLSTLRRSFPNIEFVYFVDNDDAIDTITNDNWQDCLRNIFYENKNNNNPSEPLRFEPLCCFFPPNIFEKMQDKKKELRRIYEINVLKDRIVCVIKSVYTAAGNAFFLMMAWHLLVTAKNKHFLFKVVLYRLYSYFLRFDKWKSYYYTAACHIPIIILLAFYGQWDALPNVFKLPHAKGFLGFTTFLSFMDYFFNMKVYRNSSRIIDNHEIKEIINSFDTYIKKVENIADAM